MSIAFAIILGAFIMFLIVRIFHCRFFGHTPPVYAEPGWFSPGQEYGDLHVGTTDGIGRLHGHVTGNCARCEKTFIIARVHIPRDGIKRNIARGWLSD